MRRIKVFATVAAGSILALTGAGGCDRTPAPTEADKEHAVNQNQARVAAYGKSAVPTTARGSANGQAGARGASGR